MALHRMHSTFSETPSSVTGSSNEEEAEAIANTLSEVESVLGHPAVGGLQAFGSVGDVLSLIQTRIDALVGHVSEERIDALRQRVERATLAHRARIPPDELERRLSQQSEAGSAINRTDSVASVTIVRRPTIDDAIRSVWPAGCSAETPREMVRLGSDGLNGGDGGDGGGDAGAAGLTPSVVEKKEEDMGGCLSQSSPMDVAPDDAFGDMDVEETGRGSHNGGDGSGDGGGDEQGGGGGYSSVGLGGIAPGSALLDASSGGRHTAVYSWGRGDQGALLHPDDADHTAANALVRMRAGAEVVQIAASRYHTMAVTASGDLIACGSNDEGQVRPDHIAAAAASAGDGGTGGDGNGGNGGSEPANSVAAASEVGDAGTAGPPTMTAGGTENEAEKPTHVALYIVPILVEPLQTHRVASVACGLAHTAAVTASGAVLTWGGNEAGQLGHSDGASRAQPRAMLGASWSGRQRAVAVACGDLYTLVLTAAGQVLSCGIGDCVGSGDGKSRSRVAPIPALASVPVTALAAGPTHAVAVSATGTAFAWGMNRYGQCCVVPPPLLAPPDAKNGGVKAVVAKEEEEGIILAPRRCIGTGFLPDFRNNGSGGGGGGGGGSVGGGNNDAASSGEDDETDPEWGPLPVETAACGQGHTVVVARDGRVVVWGRNRHGQLGLDPGVVGAAAKRPLLLPLPAAALQVAAGEDHTLLLTADGRLLAMGQNDASQLGLPPEACWEDGTRGGVGGIGNSRGGGEDGGEGAWRQTWLWRPTEVPQLCNVGVLSVVAGGSQSFAVALEPKGGNLGAGGTANGAAMPLLRQFSVTVAAAGPDTTTVWKDMVAAATLGSDERRRLIRAVHDAFGSANALNRSFLKEVPADGGGADGDGAGGSGRIGDGGGDGSISGGGGPVTVLVLDVVGLEELYVSLIRLGIDVIGALAAAIATGLREMAPHAASLTDPDAFRCLLAWWQCPIHASAVAERGGAGSADVFVQLCSVLLSLPYAGHRRIMQWVQNLYPSHIFASRLLKPLQAALTRHLQVQRGSGVAVPTASLVAQWLYAINDVSRKVPYQQFYNEAVSSIEPQPLFNDLVHWKRASMEERRRRYFFCSYSFLLNAHAKKMLMQLEALMEQTRAAQSAAQVRFDPERGLVLMQGQPYLVLRVDRQHLLAQTLHQMAGVADGELSKELKVVFAGEEGVDEGGVRKEFFQLLIGQLFDISYGMFLQLGKSQELWFNRDCTWCEEEYSLIGTLMGLAVYNAVLLDVRFPLAVYKKLLGLPLCLNDLEDLDPELRHGLQALLDYDKDDVEDVFCRTFEITWDDFGQQRSHELRPGGAETAVTAANKEEYVAGYCAWLLTGSVAAQFDSFFRGFNRVMGRALGSLALLRAEELELLVAGQPHLDFRELEKVAKYEGGYSVEHPTVKQLWKVVLSMDLDTQRKFLMFVTGTMKAPVGGLGKLRFVVQRAGPDSMQLPTSHTCFNTLMVPEYSSEEKLRERLFLAVEECEGFGLK